MTPEQEIMLGERDIASGISVLQDHVLKSPRLVERDRKEIEGFIESLTAILAQLSERKAA